MRYPGSEPGLRPGLTPATSSSLSSLPMASVSTSAPALGFRGSFETAPGVLAEYSGASGPVTLYPEAVATPMDAADVATLVHWARAEGVPLVSRGAGTGMPGGNVGRGVSVDLTRHFARLHRVHSEARTVFAEAGVTLQRVEEAAREHGLFFPPLPSSADRCSVGGVVANNAAGARSFRYGTTRDWVAAVTATLADGSEVTLSEGDPGPDPFRRLHARLAPARDTILASWPRVRKNSSGYALDRFLPEGEALSLLPASEGTLAIFTGATLRLAPLPARRAVVLLSLRDLDQVPVVASRARDLSASACEFFGRRFVQLVDAAGTVDVLEAADALVLVELEGSKEEVAEGAHSLTALADSLSAPVSTATDEGERARLWGIRHAASPAVAAAAGRGLVSTQFIEDSVVPPDTLPAYVRGVEAILEDVGLDAVVFGHAGDGNAHVNPLVPWREADWRIRVRDALERSVELVAALGGTLSGEHGDGRIRAPMLSRIWSQAAMDGFRAAKTELDPDGILNPGVILPLPGQDPLDGLGAGWPTLFAREAS